MKKKLKIKFWKAKKALAMQIIEQEGLPTYKNKGRVWITTHPSIYTSIQLRGSHKDCNLSITHKRFCTNQERDAYLDKAIWAITDELFTANGELKVGQARPIAKRTEPKVEVNGEIRTYTWEEK